jgi:hypothetical protein
MRLFGLGKRQVQHDPGHSAALLQDARQRFGVHIQGRFPDQADALVRLLEGDDGVIVAEAIVRECADAAYADLYAQAAELHRRTGRAPAVDRRNYRPLWQAAGPQLRWPLFALSGGLHPYVQVAAAVTVIGTQAKRAVRVTDPFPLLSHLLELLDLTIDGWEYGRVFVDVDAASLADNLINTARDLRDAMGDPPPLPPPVRELMRRNHTIDVHDATGVRVGGFNPGKRMREALLA